MVLPQTETIPISTMQSLKSYMNIIVKDHVHCMYRNQPMKYSVQLFLTFPYNLPS